MTVWYRHPPGETPEARAERVALEIVIFGVLWPQFSAMETAKEGRDLALARRDKRVPNSSGGPRYAHSEEAREKLGEEAEALQQTLDDLARKAAHYLHENAPESLSKHTTVELVEWAILKDYAPKDAA